MANPPPTRNAGKIGGNVRVSVRIPLPPNDASYSRLMPAFLCAVSGTMDPFSEGIFRIMELMDSSDELIKKTATDLFDSMALIQRARRKEANPLLEEEIQQLKKKSHRLQVELGLLCIGHHPSQEPPTPPHEPPSLTPPSSRPPPQREQRRLSRRNSGSGIRRREPGELVWCAFKEGGADCWYSGTVVEYIERFDQYQVRFENGDVKTKSYTINAN